MIGTDTMVEPLVFKGNKAQARAATKDGAVHVVERVWHEYPLQTFIETQHLARFKAGLRWGQKLPSEGNLVRCDFDEYAIEYLLGEEKRTIGFIKVHSLNSRGFHRAIYEKSFWANNPHPHRGLLLSAPDIEILKAQWIAAAAIASCGKTLNEEVVETGKEVGRRIGAT